jgi:pyruvate-formate lyase-activating enzyme
MVDLKALEPSVHRRLTGDSKVRPLVVPGYNDAADTLRRTGVYLATHAAGVPVRVIGYRPHGVRAIARRIPARTADKRAEYGAWIGESVPSDLVTVV